jgi:hypothetical protein
VSSDTWTHSMALALRYVNHFTGAAVADELPVRLDKTYQKPVTVVDSSNFRHSDGTYRFVDLSGGNHTVLWRPAFTDEYLGWVTWEPPLTVSLPGADVTSAIERDLWPAPSAQVAPAMTAIRGKLSGNNSADLEVRIATTIAAAAHYTRSDASGEFLFLIPGPVTPTSLGRVDLQIEVEGGSRVVNGGAFIPASSGAPFVNFSFQITPGQCSRIVFQIT